MDNSQTAAPCQCSSQVQSCGCTAPLSPPAAPRVTDSTITFANRLDHVLARWGVNRMGHIVDPGLYRLGHSRS